MAYLNANIPVEYAQIRREYLYDLRKHHGEVEDCVIFGVSSITGRALLFHAIMENGAIFYRLPISAFIQRGYKPDDVPKRRLDELQLWNAFSYYPSVHCWDILESQAGKYIGKDKNGIMVDIYLLLTLHILKLIYLTLIIQRSRTNISALIYLP